jgi:hypothetical protein
LVQFVEKAMLETEADLVFTHHHRGRPMTIICIRSRACQAAIRLFPRRSGVRRARLYYSEILSSTDWALPGGTLQFTPDTFIDGHGFLERKLEALRAYRA